jgi:hypothetical protein
VPCCVFKKRAEREGSGASSDEAASFHLFLASKDCQQKNVFFDKEILFTIQQEDNSADLVKAIRKNDWNRSRITQLE